MNLWERFNNREFVWSAATLTLSLLLFLHIFLTLLAFRSNAFLPTTLHALTALLTMLALVLPIVNQGVLPIRLFSLAGSWLCISVATISPAYGYSWLPFLFLAAYFLFPLKAANQINVFGSVFWSVTSLPALGPIGVVMECIPLLFMALMASLVVRHFKFLKSRSEEAAATDPETGCGNRVRLKKEMERAIGLNQRYHIPTVAMRITVRHSSASGVLPEQTIKELVSIWLSRLRQTDLLCRYDTNIFICMLPNTGLSSATSLGNDLAGATSAYDLSHKPCVEFDYYALDSEDRSQAEDWLRALLNPDRDEDTKNHKSQIFGRQSFRI